MASVEERVNLNLGILICQVFPAIAYFSVRLISAQSWKKCVLTGQKWPGCKVDSSLVQIDLDRQIFFLATIGAGLFFYPIKVLANTYQFQ